MRRALWIAVAVGITGCSAKPPVVKAVPAPIDPWVLTCTDVQSPEPAWLSNGIYGYRISRFGQPIRQFSINDYEATDQERILPKEIPLGKDPEDVSNYSQSLDMRTGELRTTWTANGDTTTIFSVVDSKGRLISKVGHTNPEIMEIRVFGGDPSSEEPGIAFDQAKSECTKEWETDIEIDGPVEDQQAVRSFLFYLRRAIHPSSRRAVAPFALSNKTYHGHVFWDADIWVFPALALLDPARAKTIPQYRIATIPVAKQNFQEWMQSGKPHGNGGKPDAPAKGSPLGIKFAWESSVTGKETVRSDSQFEDHITGSVAWGISLSNALGLTNDKEIIAGAAEFYRERSVEGPKGREIKGTLSPDEFHIGDNDLYTNLLAQWCMNGGKWDGPNKFKLPSKDGALLTYDGDNSKAYKQAAAVLAIFPLHFPLAVAQSQQMMERFESKITPNGPAMSDSIHALISARNSESDLAYETWRKSWQPFTDQPLLLFSEKRNKALTYFTTGAGGCLQTVLFGFLNIRITQEKPKSGWMRPLKNGFWVSSSPRIPQEWKSVKVKSLSILGKKETLIFDSGGVKSTK
ncbi:MAG: hypothetical protein ABL949_07875 [Fimbriimonadaceae bacterium]